MRAESSLSLPRVGKSLHSFAQLREQIALSTALRFRFD